MPGGRGFNRGCAIAGVWTHMLRLFVLTITLPFTAFAADTDDSDGWPSDTFCAADTSDTDRDDCDGENDGETDTEEDAADSDTDVFLDGDLSGELIGETGGPACASVSFAGGLGMAVAVLALATRRRQTPR